MITALPIPAMTGLLILASAGGGIQCSVPKAPEIAIVPVSREIQYDFSVSSRELSRQKTDTSSPYPAGSDTATGGLRVDQPTIAIEVDMGNAEYPSRGQSCQWYDKVNVTITLSPHIYIAREYNALGPCRDAIMAHELRHVDVDREMMNKYSYVIGEAVRQMVDKTGALGPYDTGRTAALEQDMVDAVKKTVTEIEKPLQKEMQDRQAQVNSLAEYQRITTICYGIHP